MKQIIKSIIIHLYAFFKGNRDSKIIYYHDVHKDVQYTDMGTSLDLFKKHIEAIRKTGFEIVPKIKSQLNQIMICFDDGFKGIWDCREYFIQNKIFPTIFIAVDLIGKEGYLNIEEIRELQRIGFIFQSHTWSHKNLTKFTKEELNKELLGSKIELEKILGKSVTELCFPQGYFNDTVISVALESGYNTLYSSISGNYNTRIFPHTICRDLVQSYNDKLIIATIKGGCNIFQRRNITMHYRKIC